MISNSPILKIGEYSLQILPDLDYKNAYISIGITENQYDRRAKVKCSQLLIGSCYVQ